MMYHDKGNVEYQPILLTINFAFIMKTVIKGDLKKKGITENKIA